MKMIALKPIDGDNILSAFDLELAEEQKAFVSHPMRSLALGYVYHDQCRAYGIYDDDRMIGYAMLRAEQDNKSCTLWHFMIDRKMQGLGFGRAALASILELIRSGISGACTQVLLTCNPKNEAALQLYRSFGFHTTGRWEGAEIELKLEW